MLRKVCLPRSFLQISRVLRPDLVSNRIQQLRFESTNKPGFRESLFLSQFVPDYWPQKNKIILDDGFTIESDYSNRTTEEVVQVFERLSYHCNAMESLISEEKYDPVIKAVIQKLPDMTDDEVIKVLVDLTRFPQMTSPRAHNYSELWNAIDNECWVRCKYWRFPLILKVMNAYYRLGLNRISAFNSKAVLKMSYKFDKLTPRMLVEFMFYQSMIRHKDVAMYNAEARFAEIIHELTIDEIGIIGLGFFKREAKLLNHRLIDIIYQRLLQDIDSIQDLTMVNLIKILRYSSKPSHCRLMDKINEVLVSRIDKYNLITCMHIALLGINLQNFNEELTLKIIQRMNDNIERVRLKELDRMTLVIALYDITTESGIEIEFMKKVLKELKVRVKEIVNHPRCYTSTIHYMSMKGIYDLELISAALKENFLQFAYGRNLKAYSREVLCIESFTKINLKGIYDGPELPDKIRRNIATFQSNYIPYRNQPYKLTHTDKIILDAQEFAEIKFGSNILTQALPHFERPDIIYCFDENGKSLTAELKDCFQARSEHSGQIFSKEFVLSQKAELASQIDKLRMLAIVIGGWNFYVRDSKKPAGPLRMKIEQLKLIGYIPVLIHWHDWANTSLDFKQEMFMRKMNEALSLDNNQ